MRRFMLTLGLMLWASQIEASIFFTPDEFNLNVKAIFNDTGTDTFCWQCGDANPLNDFQAVLSFPDLIAEPWPDLGFVGYSGLAQLQSTATSYLGLDAHFALHAKLTAWGHSLPESLVNPSVSFGVIPGRFLGVDGGTALVLECCDGFIDGVGFQQAFFPSTPFIVPPGGLKKLVNLELHPSFLIEYTPGVVPEPTSWLLLGSGFAAAALRRRRALRRGSPRM